MKPINISLLCKTPLVILSVLLIVLTLSCVVCSYTACDNAYADEITATNVIFTLPAVSFIGYGNNSLTSSNYKNTSVAYLYQDYINVNYSLITSKINISSAVHLVDGIWDKFEGVNLTVNNHYGINQTNNENSIAWYYTDNRLVGRQQNQYSTRVFVSSNSAFRNGATFFKLEIMPCYNIFTDSAFIGVCYKIYDTSGRYIQIIFNKFFVFKSQTADYNSLQDAINSNAWDNTINVVYYYQTNLNDNQYYQEGFSAGQISTENYYSNGGEGYNNIYNAGYNVGYNAGNTAGYNSGYNQGVDNANQYTFSALISAVFDVPVQTIIGLLDWDILGVNLKTLLLSLFSVAVVIFIVKIALGRS